MKDIGVAVVVDANQRAQAGLLNQHLKPMKSYDEHSEGLVCKFAYPSLAKHVHGHGNVHALLPLERP